MLGEKEQLFRVVKQALVFELGDWGSNLFPINSIELDYEVFFFKPMIEL